MPLAPSQNQVGISPSLPVATAQTNNKDDHPIEVPGSTVRMNNVNEAAPSYYYSHPNFHRNSVPKIIRVPETIKVCIYIGVMLYTELSIPQKDLLHEYVMLSHIYE